MTYRSTKTYGHEIGLSCVFRQWRAESNCRFLHGYVLAIKFTFEASDLDERNWVIDFGSLKSLKEMLEYLFDHKTLVAEDDPRLALFTELYREGLIQLRVLPAVGCEKIAEYIAGVTEAWLADNGYAPRVRVVKVEVKEHGANAASWLED